LSTISLIRGRVQRALFHWVLTGAFAVILLGYSVYLAIDPITAQALSKEDALVENLGAFFSLTASFLFLFCYFKSEAETNRFLGQSTRRNVWFLALAALMFVCFGEEISWGQRIFGLETSEILEELNAQKEINLHNLWLFHATNPDGTRKSNLELMLNANRLYSLFWMTYCVLLPLAVLASQRLRRLASFSGVPIPAIEVGALFLTNYVLFQTVVALAELDRELVAAFDELKESNYALCYAVLAIYFLEFYRRNKLSAAED
jgi:hypothetical protein